jgi:hypothetical protein
VAHLDEEILRVAATEHEAQRAPSEDHS